MALVLNQQVETSLPIEAVGITPNQLLGKSNATIEKMTVWHGRHELELAELFQVSGKMDDSATIVFQGNLKSVQGLGTGMETGNLHIESEAGCRVGSQMSGGRIQCRSHVSDYLGAEMTGGRIDVAGNAGNFVGGPLPGSKAGMNRGSILIQGNAGDGTGRRMRRGTVVVGGSAGRLTGWEMLAGTIVVMDQCGDDLGSEMKRGTIVIAGKYNHALLPTFKRGGQFPVPILLMMSTWLAEPGFSFHRESFDSSFAMFHGDGLQGGRGELFIANYRAT